MKTTFKVAQSGTWDLGNGRAKVVQALTKPLGCSTLWNSWHVHAVLGVYFVLFFFLSKEPCLVFGTSCKPNCSKLATWFPVPHFCMPTKRHLGPIYRSDLGLANHSWGQLGLSAAHGAVRIHKDHESGWALIGALSYWVTQTSSHRELPFCFVLVSQPQGGCDAIKHLCKWRWEGFS